MITKILNEEWKLNEILGRRIKEPLRLGSSGKGMRRVYGRFQVYVLEGTKIYLSKKKKKKPN